MLTRIGSLHHVLRLFWIFWLVLIAGASNAAEQDIEAAFATHVQAVQLRDMAALERTITADDQLTLILPNGVHTSTRQAYVDFHRSFFESTTWTIRFDPVSKVIGPDFAVLTTRSLYQDVDNGKPIRTRSWVTFTFRKESGEWRLIHDQNTRLPPEEQAASPAAHDGPHRKHNEDKSR